MSHLSTPAQRVNSFDTSRKTLVPRPRWLDQVSRRVVHAGLGKLQIGQLTLRENGVSHLFPALDRQQASLVGEIQVRDARFYGALVTGGSLGAGDAFVNGWWESPCLVDTLRLAARNGALVHNLARLTRSWFEWPARMVHRWRRNSVQGSRRNIADHYDLSNAFFQLWLDPTLTYSSAIFRGPDDSLEEGQKNKYDRLAQLLHLQPQDHLLEIGTGWGGFAMHVAKNYRVQVTTTTISHEQYELAAQRIREAGLEGQITLLKRDYRQLTGQFDKIASIEMIEAVGHRFLPGFFAKCSELLRPSGLLALQAITMPDDRYAQYVRGVDFIQKYVFPGGCLPSMAAMRQAVQGRTDMRIVTWCDYAEHYARTLRAWSEAFEHRIDEVQALMPSPRFQRIWRYYLAYCEAGFREELIGVKQILLAKPGASLR